MKREKQIEALLEAIEYAEAARKELAFVRPAAALYFGKGIHLLAEELEKLEEPQGEK